MVWRIALTGLVVAGCVGGVALAQKSGSRADSAAAPMSKDPVERVALEHSLDGDELKALEGQTATLLMKNGDEEKDIVIKKFVTAAKTPDRFRSLEITINGKTTRKFNADKVFEIRTGDTTYPVNLLPTQRMYVLDDLASRTEAIKSQLSGPHHFWEEISSEERDQRIGEQKEYLKKVGEHFARLPMQMHETKYFLFFTDMPPGQVAPFVLNLDRMYEFLGQAFGVKPGDNIWRGKSPVICFTDRTAFYEFETKFMDNADAVGAQGICHQSTDGTVITACFRGEDPDYFAAVLVHETAHGYIHRVKTSTFLTTWVNEGIAEWVAGSIVPKEGRTGEVGRRQQAGAQLVRQMGRLGRFYDLDGLSREQYGIASSMVELLLKISPEQFKVFFNGIKEGLKWEDSLQRAYGMTRQDLTALYGKTIGMPGLME
jgi:hypothetical protein